MEIRLVGGRADGQAVKLRYFSAFTERPIEFRNAGIFIERYRIKQNALGWLGVYVGLRRSRELARRFNPARLR